MYHFLFLREEVNMKISFDTNQPIYTQIIMDFKRRLVNGSIKPGEKIPSVRELAAELGVTPNTLQRAFAELERDELIRTERTSGRYATEDEDKLIKLRKEMSAATVKEYFKEMRALGFNEQEAREAIKNIEEAKIFHAGV
jgi:DNA-binding transcriptional regulator YhcF (GntR family)